MFNRYVLALIALCLSLLQAWDSNALSAEGLVLVVIGTAVLLPSLAIAVTPDDRIRFGAVAGGLVILFAARVMSDTPMPELALAAVFPGILALLARFARMQTVSSGKAPLP